MEINQTRIVYWYMILTSRGDDEFFCVIWTTFDLFRSALIYCINILKFKNNNTNRYMYECIGEGFKGI